MGLESFSCCFYTREVEQKRKRTSAGINNTLHNSYQLSVTSFLKISEMREKRRSTQRDNYLPMSSSLLFIDALLLLLAEMKKEGKKVVSHTERRTSGGSLKVKPANERRLASAPCAVCMA